MPVTVDYLIVGSGLTGATIARHLHDQGKKVLVIERRAHIGGNVHDHSTPSGVRVHTYGPHYFRTNDDRLWDYVRRFSDFYPYVPCLKTSVGGGLENWPIAGSYIRNLTGVDWKPTTADPNAGNFEEACLSMMPAKIYEEFVKGYTEKQWGVPAHTLSADLAKRFDVRVDDDPRLMRHKHQGIPVGGYSKWMSSMLSGIPVIKGVDYQECKSSYTAGKLLIYTGPIDEFFNYRFGKLAYRGQHREHYFHPDKDYILPCGQVNNPTRLLGPHIRTLEWKHMMPPEEKSRIRGTLVTNEIPYTPTNSNDFEYPFPDEKNRNLYLAYRSLADREAERLLICGRLGEYRYYDMDQAIARALKLASQIS